MTVPASGTYVWDVNPSTRPLSPARSEAWTVTCESSAGTVLESRQVVVDRGEQVTAIARGRYRLVATGRDSAGRLLRAAATVRYTR